MSSGAAAGDTPRGVGTPQRIDVVAAVIVDSLAQPTRLLAGRRTEPPRLAGGWEIPGGKIEPGESPDEALHREIREEIGVQIALGDHVIGPLDGLWPLGTRYRMAVRLAEVTRGEARALADHSEVRWLGPQTLWTVNWLPANRNILAAAAARLWP